MNFTPEQVENGYLLVKFWKPFVNCFSPSDGRGHFGAFSTCSRREIHERERYRTVLKTDVQRMKSLLQGQEYLYNRIKITYNQTNKTKLRPMNQPMNSFRHNKINFFGFECRWLRVIHTGLLFCSTRSSSYNFNADRTTFFTFTAHLRKP